MILISYGLPKSASTFVFFTLTSLAEGAGETIWNRLNARMPKGKQDPYQPVVDRAYIELARANWPENELLPIKTHCPLDPFIAAEIGAGRLKACASFRDPRDSVLALLDAGQRDRDAGKDSFFAKLNSMDDALNVLRNQLGKTMAWLETPGVMPVPFKLAALHPDVLSRRLAEFAGTPDALSRIDAAAPKKEDVPEYNKGKLTRYESEMAENDRARIETLFGDEIAYFESLTHTVFDSLNLPDLETA